MKEVLGNMQIDLKSSEMLQEGFSDIQDISLFKKTIHDSSKESSYVLEKENSLLNLKSINDTSSISRMNKSKNLLSKFNLVSNSRL